MKRALIIDDDAISRTHVAGLLEREGWTCMQLDSPIGATREILANGIRVVVIDVMMPSMRGDLLAKLLRENRRLPDLCLLLISGNTDREFFRLAAEAKADGLISKNELETSLVPAIQKALDSRGIPI